jgi:hypothetical protein
MKGPAWWPWVWDLMSVSRLAGHPRLLALAPGLEPCAACVLRLIAQPADGAASPLATKLRLAPRTKRTKARAA